MNALEEHFEVQCSKNAQNTVKSRPNLLVNLKAPLHVVTTTEDILQKLFIFKVDLKKIINNEWKMSNIHSTINMQSVL